MTAAELSKGADFALLVSVAPASADAFAEELRQVKSALLDWKAKRQDRCERVIFTVVSAPENHDSIETMLRQLYEEEAELSPLLHSLNVHVSLLNSRGKPVKEYSLGVAEAPAPAPPAPEPASKPRWKLW